MNLIQRVGRRGQWLMLLPFGVALAYFTVWFHEAQWQPSVDLAFLFATLCWFLAWWRTEASSLPPLKQPYWFYALYVAVLLPYCTDWRWAMTADSIGWAYGGYVLGTLGPQRSLFSLLGVGQFGYAQLVLHNLFAWFVAPTLFWHRVGQVAVGVLSVASVYTVYGRLLTPAFGLLIGACALSTSIMIVHTLCSYPLLDAVAAGHAVVAVGLWVRRDPELRKPWLMLGLSTGVLLYMTPNSWAMGICVWGWLLPLALLRRWPLSNVALGLATILIVGLPVVHQFVLGQAAELFTQVENPAWTLDKVIHLGRQGFELPFASGVQGAGAFGPQLPVGFRWLFVVGLVIAPVFARYFPGARLVFWIYLVNMILLVFTQGRYFDVSVKRGLVIIPMATYFVFVPFHRFLRSYAVVLPIIAVWASFGIYDVVARMYPGRTGATLSDGLVEVHQRFADTPICVIASPARVTTFEAGSVLDLMYGVSPHLQPAADLDDEVCRHIACYDAPIETVDFVAKGYAPIALLNTLELRCGERALSSVGADD